jgi:hypothetical protein
MVKLGNSVSEWGGFATAVIGLLLLDMLLRRF